MSESVVWSLKEACYFILLSKHHDRTWVIFFQVTHFKKWCISSFSVTVIIYHNQGRGGIAGGYQRRKLKDFQRILGREQGPTQGHIYSGCRQKFFATYF